MNENTSYAVTRYMLKSINTTTKSKYIRVSRLVSGRGRPHEQVSSLESWHMTLILSKHERFAYLKLFQNFCYSSDWSRIFSFLLYI